MGPIFGIGLVLPFLVDDDVYDDYSYLNTEDDEGSQRTSGFELGGQTSATKSGNCRNGEPVIDLVRPATISRQAGVSLTIEGCNLSPKGQSKGLETDITKFAVFFISGSDQVRCNVIHYYTTNDQIICETTEFPHDGDFFVKVFANGREIGENGYGKTCKTCRIRAYSNYNPVIKSIYPSNVAKNGDVIELTGRIFTDAYEEDRCVLGDDDDDCEQSDRVEEGSNYLLGQPKFVDRIGRVVGTCEMNEKLGIGPNVKLTNYNDGYIRCKISSNFIGNVNVTFSTRFNGQSASDSSLYSVVGADNDLINFQLIPTVSDVVNGGGSIMGGNTVVVRGGPFLEGETSVDIDGQPAEITSLSETELTLAAPAKRSPNECPGVGERGFLSKVWNFAASNVWEPLFTEPESFAVTKAMFAQKGKWTAHLEGYFVAPSNGFYSFLVAANQEGRLFFSNSSCMSEARLVTDVRNSRNQIDFFGESRRAVMSKTFLSEGKGYYIRAEGYSLSQWEDGFLNIGVLYHSASGDDQSAMSYQFESQVVSITDQEQDEIQDITFDNAPMDATFRLVVDGTETSLLSGASTNDDISEALNALSASTCKDRGVVSAAFRNTMEDNEVWPRERYVRTVEPFCGSRTFQLDGPRNKLTVYDAKRYGSNKQIDLNLNPHICFAYFGNIGSKIKLTIEAGKYRGVRTYDLGIVPTDKWRYKCWNMVTEFIAGDLLVQKKISPSDEIQVKQVQMSTSDDDVAYVDEFIIGRVEGFFDVQQVSLGVRPSGYIKRFLAKWMTIGGNPTLRLEYSSDECGLDISLIRLTGHNEFEEINDPLTHFYTFDTFTAKVDRRSKMSPGVIGNFDLTYKSKILSAKVDWSGKQLQQKMAAVFGNEFSAASVVKTGECKSGYTYKVTWDTAGDKGQLELDNVAVTGISVQAETVTLNDGGLLVPFISSGLLAKPVDFTPQIHVYVRNVLADCVNGICGYNWSQKKTMAIDSVRQVDESQYEIVGGKFTNNTLILVGGIAAEQVEMTEDRIVFVVPEVSGEVSVRAFNAQSGFSFGSFTITVNSKLTSVIPPTTGLGGGQVLKVNGAGFNRETTFSINGKPCETVLITYDMIACKAPVNPAGSYVISVNNVDSDLTVSYQSGISAKITDISNTVSGVSGGDEFVLSGENLGDNGEVLVGDAAAEVITWSDIKIVAKYPSNAIGLYNVRIKNNNGYAENSASVTYRLEVHSVYPKRSSVAGGVQMTVKGYGFDGDTVVTIGDTACDISDITPSSILCTTQTAVNEHIVTNGVVHIAGAMVNSWTPRSIVIALGERVTWKWNIPLSSGETPKVTIQQTISDGRVEYNGVGFQSKTFKAISGEWSYDFLIPGTYYYSSGYIENSESIALTGTIVVTDTSSERNVPVTVFVGDQEAVHVPGSDQFASDVDNTCSPLDTIGGGKDASDSSVVSHSFSFDNTPVITGISPKITRPGGVVTIDSSGLFQHRNCLFIKIGGFNCNIESVDVDVDSDDVELDALDGRSQQSQKKLQCRLDHDNRMTPGIICGIDINIAHVGNVLVTSKVDTCIEVKSAIKSLKPKSGSIYGGQIIDIRGEALNLSDNINDVQVLFGDTEAAIHQIRYDRLSVRVPAPSGDEDNGAAFITVKIRGQIIENIGNVIYHYDERRTPMITSVDRVNNRIAIQGRGFEGNITVAVGDYPCDMVEMMPTEIVCMAEQVPAGFYHPRVLSSIYGLAGVVDKDKTLISLVPTVTSLRPRAGSVKGGNLLTIRGLGFGDAKNMRVGWDGVHVEKYDDDIVSSTTDTLIVRVPKLKNSDSHILKEASVKISMAGSDGVVTYPTQTYTFMKSLSPKITSCSPNIHLNGNTILTIGGSDLRCTNVKIVIDDNECDIVDCSETSIQCRAPFVSAGDHIVTVFDNKYGYGSTEVIVQYDLTLSDVQPRIGSFGGDQRLSVVGSGMTEETIVSICNDQCSFESLEEQDGQQILHCRTPPVGNSKTCKVKIELNGETSTTAIEYVYDWDTASPFVERIKPNRGQVIGGTKVTIVGSLFEDEVDVMIGEHVCNVDSVTATEIICTTTGATRSEVLPVTVNVRRLGKQMEVVQFWYVNSWSSPRTWGCGDEDCSNMPADGDIIEIPDGIDLLLDESTPLLHILIVNGGKLIFDRERDIHLRAQYILLTNGGHVQIGSESEPYLRNAHIELYGHRRSTRLPLYGSKTFAIHDGSLDMHGKAVSKAWVKLATTVRAGDDWLQLTESVNDWPIGAKIVIASTGGMDSVHENEEVEIVKQNGNMIKVYPKLKHQHLGVVSTWGTKVLDQRAEVGLLSRNIKVSGNIHSTWVEHIEACKLPTIDGMSQVQTCFQGRFGEEVGSDEFGAHMHFGPGTRRVRMSNVEVFHAGQAFQLGKYPVHFHLVGHQPESYVKKCSIHHTFNRALTFHGVHGLLADGNVAYNIKGHGFFIEDGIETGNMIHNNLAVGVIASSSLLSTDLWAAAFWITNPDNEYVNNAAAGGSHNGFWLNPPGKPTGPSFTRKLCPQKTPLRKFYGNSAHSMGLFGLWIYPFFTPVPNGDCSLDGQVSYQVAKFEKFQAWGCKRGAEGVFVTSIQWIDFIVADNNKAGLSFMETKLDVFGGDGLMIKDSVIIGHSNIAETRCNEDMVGLETPWKQGGFAVDGLSFYNFDENCVAINPCYRAYQNDCANRGEYKNIEWHNATRKINFAWEHEYDFHDMDGSLTGSGVESHLLTKSDMLPPNSCNDAGLSDFNYGKVNATLCDATVKLHRFGLNNLVPENLNGANLIISNKYGSFKSVWRSLRVTHPKGWLGMVLDGEDHEYQFEGFNTLSNLTYTADFMHFAEGDHVIMSRSFSDQINYAQVSSRSDTIFSDLLDTNSENLDTVLDSGSGQVSYIVSGKGSERSTSNPLGRNVHVEFQVQNKQVTSEEQEASLLEKFNNQESCVYSDRDCWFVPNDAGDTIIPVDRHVYIDVPSLSVTNLIVDGTLEFFPDQDTHVKAENIVVNGRMVAGSESSPLPCSREVVIELLSRHNSPAILTDNKPSVGKKAIVVYGILELYGCGGTNHALLTDPVVPGQTSIVLDRDPSWDQDDEIVIAGTSYNGAEAEVMTVVSVNGNVVELSDPLKFYHDASATSYDDKTFIVNAEVGLLNKNIRLVGSNNDHRFGGRILVSENSNQNTAGTTFAVISNVEFVGFGQFGYSDPDDPRFSVAFSGVTTASAVTGCSFRNSFSTAVGVVHSFNINIDNNVVYRPIGDGIRVAGVGTGNAVRNNIVVNVLHPLLETDSGEGLDGSRFRQFPSGIRTEESDKSVTLESNHIAGVEGFGYRTRGETCSLADSCLTQEQNHNLMNHVHGTHQGVSIWLISQMECSLVSNFASYRNIDYGIYLQTESSLIVDNCIMFDNPVSLLPFVIKPEPIEHELVEKSVTIRNSLIGGMSDTFDCTRDFEQIIKGSGSRYFTKTDGLRAPRTDTGGFTGYMLTTFMGSKNRSPIEAWHTVWSKAQLLGSSCLLDNTFASFDGRCNVNSIAISSNKDSPDMMHPTTAERNFMINVPDENRLIFHRPKLEWVTSEEKARCVDMDCDAAKKIMIKDDGSLSGTGYAVTIIAQSDFEWNGDTRRGLGDYRIPYVMLTNSDGSKRDINEYAPSKGIIQDGSCSRNDDWLADVCAGINHQLVIYESLDSDSVDRRLSPVGLRSDTGYIDLINGPSAHKGDHGYSAVNRLSTFHMIAASNHQFDLAFTGTVPQKARIHQPMSGENDFLILSIFMGRAQRTEVYRKGMLVKPNNAFLDKHGSFSYEYPDDKFIPDINEGVLLSPGANYFDRTGMTLHLVVRGNEPLDLKTSQTIIVNMDTVMEMTPEELYSQKQLGPILASILGISDSFVKVVNINGNTDSGSRRRREGVNSAKLMFEVGSLGAGAPVARAAGPKKDMDIDELLAVQNKVLEAKTVCTIKSEMKAKLDIDVIGISVNGVNNNEAPAQRSATFSMGDGDDFVDPFAQNVGKVITVPSKLNIFRQPTLEIEEGEQFSTQPWIELLDENGARVISSEFSISVRLVLSTSEVVAIGAVGKKKKKHNRAEAVDAVVDGMALTGLTTIPIGLDGFAKFTNLGLEGASMGRKLALEFYLDGDGLEICGQGTLTMQSRSSTIEIESSGEETGIYCKQGVARSSQLGGRGKKKKGPKGSSGGSAHVSCADLQLSTLGSLITDLKIGGFIRIKSAAGAVSNIPSASIISLTLANNELSDGEELAHFLSFLPNLTKLTLSNNKFDDLPSNTLHGNPKLVSINLSENLMSSFPEQFFDKQKISKKSDLKFSCTMKYVPIDILINNPKTAKSFISAAEFC